MVRTHAQTVRNLGELFLNDFWVVVEGVEWGGGGLGGGSIDLFLVFNAQATTKVIIITRAKLDSTNRK